MRKTENFSLLLIKDAEETITEKILYDTESGDIFYKKNDLESVSLYEDIINYLDELIDTLEPETKYKYNDYLPLQL